MPASQLLSAAMLQFVAAYSIIVVVPGPIALTTGGIAALHGFRGAIPLLAGIAIGTAALTAAVAWGAAHLASMLSLPAAQLVGAAVLLWLAWHILHAAPSIDAIPSPRLLAERLVQGTIVAFLSPQTASLFAVSFMGFPLRIEGPADVIAVAAVTTTMSVVWYALIAVLLSRPAMRAAAVRYHRIICRAAAGGLSMLALSSAVSASALLLPVFG
ncbi:MAG TPA: LysE family transporter [Devosia sp.]|nr:LysE family transporter [Devosia sp.]